MADPPDNKVLNTTQEDDGNVDRFSALPDYVLLYILSCFYTKSAAAWQGFILRIFSVFY